MRRPGVENALYHILQPHHVLPPQEVDLFFNQTWVRVVARAHAAGGATWQQVAGTTQELVWSLKPKPDAPERAKLVGALPALLKKLATAMESAPAI